MAGEKILNIDDSPTVQRLIEMILTTQGYKVILASDGEEGIAKARAELPAVILVDFVMPKMNGFQVCKTLKEDPKFRDTPIILVTSKGDKVGSKFVDVLGITEYFTKPFQPEDLLAKIREVIDKRNQALSPTGTISQGSRTPMTPGPGVQAAQNVIETMVRSIVMQMLDDFMTNTLPEKIQQELTRIQIGGNAGMQGNLLSVRIVEVIQMLGIQRQTGKLVIKQTGETVAVYFKDGAVVFASSNGNNGTMSAVEGFLRKSCKLEEDSLRHVLRIAEMTSRPIDSILTQEKLFDSTLFSECLRRHTEASVYKVLAWKQGNFMFEKVAVPIFANPIKLTVEDLLLEGARRADEWGLIQQKIADVNMVFEPLIGNAEELTTRGMSTIDIKVFSQVNGRRTVKEIIEFLGLDEFDVAKSLFILLSVNLIRKKR